MPVFSVIPLAENAERLKQTIGEAIDEKDVYALQGHAGWLISFNGTSVDLSNKIQVTGWAKGEASVTGPALVTHIVSYFGLAQPDLWEWIKIKFEASA